MEELKIGGTYEHYKGKRYKVIVVAHHSETMEEMVVYQGLYSGGKVWVRLKDIFLGGVVVDGQKIPRFKLIS